MSGRVRDSFGLMAVFVLAICIPAPLALLLSEPKRAKARKAWPSTPSDVRPDELGGLIDQADKLVVLEGEVKNPKVLFESTERSDLDALKAAFQVSDPGQAVHCMCEGDPVIRLYANGEQIGEITNHHAHLLRCNDLWQSDALLADAQTFLGWFDERRIAGPRKEYEANLERKNESEKAKGKWLAAMPPALRPFWSDTLRAQPDLAPLRKALESQVPDRNARILALLSWYGSGRGPWSGFPMYEVVAEDLLLNYSTAELLAAIEGQELTTAQLEGTARLFAGYTLYRQRQDDLASLPPELKSRLLKHSLATDNADKRRRAQGAFGE